VANTLLTISMITNRALPVLGNTCILTDKYNRQYDKEFGRKGEKIGGTANVRLPPRYLGTFGPALNVEPSTETYVPVSILYQFHVDIQFNTINMLLDIDEFEERFLHPACVAVGNRVDSDGAYYGFQQTAQRSGTPGTTPTAFKAFSDSRAYLISEGMPKGGMIPNAVLHPFASSAMADALKGLYNPQAHIDDAYEEGWIAKKTAGADWFEDPNVAAYSTGTLTGTPVLAGITTAVGGSAILTSGWSQTGVLNLTGLTNTAAQVYVGDTIVVAGIYPANPQNRGRYSNYLKSLVVLPPGGYAQMTGVATPGGPQFAPATLTAGTFNATPGTATTGLYTSSGSGTLSITVADCIITGGQFQNCATGALWTGTPAVACNAISATTAVNGVAAGTNSTENLYFHRDAFALAVVDLPLPRTAVEASRAYDEDLGLSIRIATQYTINNDAEPTRLDIVYGFGSLYRGLAARVSG
jgi:P22 coat protein - gene protein 5